MLLIQKSKKKKQKKTGDEIPPKEVVNKLIFVTRFYPDYFIPKRAEIDQVFKTEIYRMLKAIACSFLFICKYFEVHREEKNSQRF